MGAARDAVELVDRELAEAQVGQVLLSFGCGSVATRDEVAELFLIEAALASYRKDDVALDEALGSAAAVSPDFWLAGLGAAMQARFVAARDNRRGAGGLRFEPSLDGHALYVDGGLEVEPLKLGTGLHLLQVLAGKDVVFSSVVSISEGAEHVVEHALEPWRPPLPEVVVVPEREVRSEIAPHMALGLAMGFGGSLEGIAGGGPVTEAAQKISAPLELGATWYGSGAFVRAAVSFAPLIQTDLLFGTDAGGRASRATAGGHVAGGAALGPLDVGLLTGPSWPGRWQLRGMSALALPGPLQVELRVGANAVTQRSPEAAVELFIVLQPSL